jgi:hypothetical protein
LGEEGIDFSDVMGITVARWEISPGFYSKMMGKSDFLI